MAKIRERKTEVEKAKAKASEAERGKELEPVRSPVNQSSQMISPKAVGKCTLEKSVEQIKIEETRDKRIKAEKVFYDRREARRKMKAAKEAGRAFNRTSKRWVLPASTAGPYGEADKEFIRPPQRGK